ncbi:MAG: protein-L-isoaspartate(D-aspartate) O-methyltransferase [bacterium]|nr:protein-L-isoaspartate(D-aspartate) O-methyltransferase [Gammaproteobacteria bacterium]HIL97986.1 protein-L-isoaspartate(D-aspartate) O-methyltransferase [Pseudomonadales bacterium]
MTSQRTRNRLVSRLRQQGIQDERVLDLINSTPRHLFIDEALAHRAYEDNALPIGFNQTISQPYIVARMTESLFDGGRLERVLEIGTGSGYQTAILAQLANKVYTVERIAGLLDKAKERLKLLGTRNTRFKYDDGNIGWQEQGPFQGIIVTASPRHVPDELLSQLAAGGRMIIPVGHRQQQLKLITNTQESFQTEILEDVKFVPLMRGKA